MSGHGRTDQLLSPIRILVRMPEPENLKVQDLSKSVKQARHSEQATGHGMHCRKILFTPCCSPRAREFPRLSQLFCTTTAMGRQTCPIELAGKEHRLWLSTFLSASLIEIGCVVMSMVGCYARALWPNGAS